MKMIKCEACNEQISPKAKECPKCGHPNKKANHLSGGQVLGALFLAGIGIWFFAGGGFDQQVNRDMKKINNQVAEDALKQYNIAKRQGDFIQICVQSGLVVAAYLQAKDESNYQKWKDIQKNDCKAAGIPQ
jgi:hypothetical protein